MFYSLPFSVLLFFLNPWGNPAVATARAAIEYNVMVQGTCMSIDASC